MKETSDPDQNENEKLHNYTNYQIVCMLQNIDDIARDVLEIKEHIKKMHTGYVETLGIQDENTQKLNNIQSNMGIISRSLEHLTNALPTPASPPHYREVDVLSSKLKFSSKSDESKQILFKGIENIDKARLEKIKKGINLAREKTKLMKNRLADLPSVESLRLPKNYVSLSSLMKQNGQPSAPSILAMSGVTGEQTQGESNSKRDRSDSFFHSNKGKRGASDTNAHEASASSPFSRYTENLQSVPIRLDNPASRGYGNSLLVNIDCLDYNEVIAVLHNVHAWALQRKDEAKVSWSDVVTPIVWSFTGILKQWWERLAEEEKDQIVESTNPCLYTSW